MYLNYLVNRSKLLSESQITLSSKMTNFTVRTTSSSSYGGLSTQSYRYQSTYYWNWPLDKFRFFPMEQNPIKLCKRKTRLRTQRRKSAKQLLPPYAIKVYPSSHNPAQMQFTYFIWSVSKCYCSAYEFINKYLAIYKQTSYGETICLGTCILAVNISRKIEPL